MDDSTEEFFEKKTKRPPSEMAVMIGLLEFLEPYERVCGGILDDDEDSISGTYRRWLLHLSRTTTAR